MMIILCDIAGRHWNKVFVWRFFLSLIFFSLSLIFFFLSLHFDLFRNWKRISSFLRISYFNGFRIMITWRESFFKIILKNVLRLIYFIFTMIFNFFQFPHFIFVHFFSILFYFCAFFFILACEDFYVFICHFFFYTPHLWYRPTQCQSKLFIFNEYDLDLKCWLCLIIYFLYVLFPLPYVRSHKNFNYFYNAVNSKIIGNISRRFFFMSLRFD